MKIIETKIEGSFIIEPQVFGDERGFFLESFQDKRYKDLAGIDYLFVQDNHARSEKNVLRGLHLQKIKPQGKLVRVVRGEVFDVAVDLRPNSISYGKWESVILSEDNNKQFWIPPGLAHGYLVLSDIADFEYKVTDYFNPNDEICIRWDDPSLNIPWPTSEPNLSKKDEKGFFIADLNL